MDTLRFALIEVPGASAASLARFYFDFVVSGRPLSQLLQLGKAHQTGVFYLDQNDAAVDHQIRLFMEAPRLAQVRPQFFVCAECGDIACGAITAGIEMRDNQFIWQNFTWDFGDDEPDATNEEHIGPFVFDQTEYVQAFAELKSLLRGH